eukprot:13765094-Heterocapsa_arctica.AAC.1
MGAGSKQEFGKEWRSVGAANERWRSTTVKFPSLGIEGVNGSTGNTEPQLEEQHNGTTGVRICEARKPGQEVKSWAGITANITSWNTSGLA